MSAKKTAKRAPRADDAHRHGLIDTDLLHPHHERRTETHHELPKLPETPHHAEHKDAIRDAAHGGIDVDLLHAHLKKHEEDRQKIEERKPAPAVERKTFVSRLKSFFVRQEQPKHDAPHPTATHAPVADDAHAHGLIDADLLHPHLVKREEPPVKREEPPHKPEPQPAPKTAELVDRAVAKRSFKERLRDFFLKPHQPAQPTAKTNVERKPEAKATPEDQKPAEKTPFLKRPKSVKKPKRRLQRKSLQEYLDKAGFEVSADLVRRRTWQFVLGAFLLGTVYVLVRASLWGTGAIDVLIFILGLWTAGFAAVFLLAHGTIYFFLDYTIYRRAREIELYLPDFLQLASSNIAAGMPIDRALWFSIRPSFGVLAKEMQEVAKATMAGEDLEVSLTHFAEKYDSTVLRRSVSILIEGLRAGGEMADLLNKIALNIEEIKIMKQEMAANVTTYAIFITFASVIVAPFLFALATQLLEIIVGITGKLDLSSSSGFFTLNAADPTVIANFRMFSVTMLIVSTAFSAALVSVIKRGNVLEGIKSIPVYAISSVVIYYISLSILNGMFGGILTGG